MWTLFFGQKTCKQIKQFLFVYSWNEENIFFSCILPKCMWPLEDIPNFVRKWQHLQCSAKWPPHLDEVRTWTNCPNTECWIGHWSDNRHPSKIPKTEILCDLIEYKKGLCLRTHHHKWRMVVCLSKGLIQLIEHVLSIIQTSMTKAFANL